MSNLCKKFKSFGNWAVEYQKPQRKKVPELFSAEVMIKIAMNILSSDT